MNNAPKMLPEIAAQIWALLQTATESDDPADRFVTFATVDATYAPQVRTVALRHTNRDAAVLEVFTDRLSHKIRELTQNPRASILFWHPETRVQLRLSGTVTIRQESEVADEWNAMPKAQHENYSHMPPPGSQIGTYDDYAQHPNPERFAILRLDLSYIDYVCLAPDTHRRAAFERANDWKGQWLSP